MSFSMSQASLPVFDVGLNALSALLDKADVYAQAKKIDASVLLNARLYPDMFALVRQVQCNRSGQERFRAPGRCRTTALRGQ